MIKSIVFTLNESKFGIPIEQVGSLARLRDIQKLPKSPGWVSGLTRHRGDILPVVKIWDILETSEPEKKVLLIPRELEYCSFALSSIEGIYELKIMEKDDKFLDIPYILGYGEIEDEIVIEIDLKNLLEKGKAEVLKKIKKKNKES